MHTGIADRKDEIAAICLRNRMSRLEAFVSAERGTDFDPEKSDVDFLFEFQSPLLPGFAGKRYGLQEDLRTALVRKVDLLRIGTIRNSYLKQAIDRSSKIVHEA